MIRTVRQAYGRLSITRRILLWLILVSYLLRLVVVLEGGQFFWPDEARYDVSRDAITFLLERSTHPAFRGFGVEHLGFKLVGLVPALIEHMVGEDPRIPASFFALFSVADLVVVFAIAVRVGARETEALLATSLLMISPSFLCYSRHLLPYDLSSSFGLMAIYVALTHSDRAKRLLLTGLLAWMTFLTYNGYWVLAALAVVISATGKPANLTAVMRRLFLVGISSSAPVAVMVLTGVVIKKDVVSRYLEFSRTVVQGTFSEGWRLPWEYLWYSEHSNLLLWALSLLWLAVLVVRGRRSNSRARFGVLGIVFIYGSLVLFSVCLHKFVVYGRTARLLVPCFCLLTASAMCGLYGYGRIGRRLVFALCSLALLQGMYNVSLVMRQSFPIEFARKAKPLVGLSRNYRLVNAEFFYPYPQRMDLPPHRVILEARHPLAYYPYQYEGLKPEERKHLRSMDTRMQLVELVD